MDSMNRSLSQASAHSASTNPHASRTATSVISQINLSNLTPEEAHIHRLKLLQYRKSLANATASQAHAHNYASSSGTSAGLPPVRLATRAPQNGHGTFTSSSSPSSSPSSSSGQAGHPRRASLPKFHIQIPPFIPPLPTTPQFKPQVSAFNLNDSISLLDSGIHYVLDHQTGRPKKTGLDQTFNIQPPKSDIDLKYEALVGHIGSDTLENSITELKQIIPQRSFYFLTKMSAEIHLLLSMFAEEENSLEPYTTWLQKERLYLDDYLRRLRKYYQLTLMDYYNTYLKFTRACRICLIKITEMANKAVGDTGHDYEGSTVSIRAALRSIIQHRREVLRLGHEVVGKWDYVRRAKVAEQLRREKGVGKFEPLVNGQFNDLFRLFTDVRLELLAVLDLMHLLRNGLDAMAGPVGDEANLTQTAEEIQSFEMDDYLAVEELCEDMMALD